MKAETIKDICYKWLWKAFETGTKQDPFSADNSEYWHPAIDLKWSKEMADELQQYTEQESRERAINFANHLSDTVTNGDDLFGFDEEYINWLKEQEEQNGD